MKAPIAPCNFAAEQFAVIQITFYIIGLDASQPAQITLGPHQHLHAMLAGKQFANDVRTDETGGASDKAFHNCVGRNGFSK